MEQLSKQSFKNMTKENSAFLNALSGLKKLNDKKAGITRNVVYQPFKREVKVSDFKFTKKEFWKLWIKHSAGKYQIDQRNQDVVFTIFRYFMQEPNFNEAGLIKNQPSLDKGLLVYGDYGVGKTLLFETLHKIGKELITEHQFKGFWFNCISAGSFIETYMKEATNKESNFRMQSFYTGTLYIDDLGFEKMAFNKTEVFAELLFERNRNKVKTFCTTNLNPTSIVERYGERIGDRLPEMFNIIKWTGDSFRE
jgi:DNA replication protein DnaC